MSVRLLHGPAAAILAQHFAAGSVDMVYADPPFGNRQVWTGKAGSFSDRWSWDAAAAEGWTALHAHSPAGPLCWAPSPATTTPAGISA